MRIYSRSERQGMRVSLRWFAWEWNDRRDWQLSVFLWLVVLAAMVAACLAAPAPAQAQQDPCDVCMEEHGWGQCPCLPLVPEPTPLPVPPPPPVGGTIPPITGIACLPDTHSIDGCENKVFLPQLGR